MHFLCSYTWNGLWTDDVWILTTILSNNKNRFQFSASTVGQFASSIHTSAKTDLTFRPIRHKVSVHRSYTAHWNEEALFDEAVSSHMPHSTCTLLSAISLDLKMAANTYARIWPFLFHLWAMHKACFQFSVSTMGQNASSIHTSAESLFTEAVSSQSVHSTCTLLSAVLLNIQNGS